MAARSTEYTVLLPDWLPSSTQLGVPIYLANGAFVTHSFIIILGKKKNEGAK